METQEQSRLRPGPVPGPETKKYNVLIEPELAEWAKRQHGGLSDMVRRLLKQERDAMSRNSSSETREV